MGIDKKCDNCIHSGRPSYEYPCTDCETAYGSAPSKWESMVSATADMVEVVHGRWIDGFFKNTFECSVCFEKDVHYCYNSKSNYCPICGAKMDGDRNE